MDKIRMICEGDLECPNGVYLTKDEIKQLRDENKAILCKTCEPKYSHLSSDENNDLGWRDL